MKTYIRPSNERGHVNMGWLDTYHTFSFASYRDPAHVHFGPIRVINDDTVAGGGGFPHHPHDNMEILTYVLEGALAHRDSMGNGETINAGDVQIMSAGTGVTHSEFNASETDPVKLLQIWIFPRDKNIAPRYEQKTLPVQDGLTVIASPGGSESGVDIKQDIVVYRWNGEGEINVPSMNGLYVHVIAGEIVHEDATLKAGDAIGIQSLTTLLNAKGKDTHALLFAF